MRRKNPLNMAALFVAALLIINSTFVWAISPETQKAIDDIAASAQPGYGIGGHLISTICDTTIYSLDAGQALAKIKDYLNANLDFEVYGCEANPSGCVSIVFPADKCTKLIGGLGLGQIIPGDYCRDLEGYNMLDVNIEKYSPGNKTEESSQPVHCR